MRRDSERPSATTSDGTMHYTTDANFNVTALVDAADGDVVERYEYDPYGFVTILNGDDDRDGAVTEWADDTFQWSDWENLILFAGYQWDFFGTYYARNRYYHPTLGTWLTRDPSGYGDGMNLYQYVKSRPTGLTDPKGLMTDGDLCTPLWSWEYGTDRAAIMPGVITSPEKKAAGRELLDSTALVNDLAAIGAIAKGATGGVARASIGTGTAKAIAGGAEGAVVDVADAAVAPSVGHGIVAWYTEARKRNMGYSFWVKVEWMKCERACLSPTAVIGGLFVPGSIGKWRAKESKWFLCTEGWADTMKLMEDPGMWTVQDYPPVPSAADIDRCRERALREFKAGARQ